MRVLVTGGAGFIGSHTAQALLQAGHEVRILDGLLPPVHPNRQWPAHVSPDAELILDDVRDKEAWERALAGVDAVFHLAAYQDYLPDFSTFYSTNAVGTALLYEVVVERNLPVQRIVVASSQAVYGEGAYECGSDGVVYPGMRSPAQLAEGRWEVACPVCGGGMSPRPSVESEVHPQNAYGLSKFAQEQLATVLGRRYGIPTVALRYSIVQGARQSIHNAYSGVCRLFSLAVRAGRRPVAYEDGLQLRDYVNIHDVVAANLLALEHPAAAFEVFNVSGPRSWTVLEFGALVARCAGADLLPVAAGEYRFGDTRHVLSDSSKLQRLGWVARGTIYESVREYISWLDTLDDWDEAKGDAACERMRSLGVVRQSCGVSSCRSGR